MHQSQLLSIVRVERQRIKHHRGKNQKINFFYSLLAQSTGGPKVLETMAKTKASRLAEQRFRLAKKWDALPMVRNRLRKGKESFIRLTTTEAGEIIISTKSIQQNHQVLLALLEEFGLFCQTIETLVDQAC